MGWAISEDDGRDIGYGVPAICDHPGCEERIDRGLSYVCGSDPFGGEHGCGLFFCGEHHHCHGRRDSNGSISYPQLCEACAKKRKRLFDPKPDVREWIQHKLTHESWAPWRKENPAEVKRLESLLPTAPIYGEPL